MLKIGEYRFVCPSCGSHNGKYLNYDGSNYQPSHFLVGNYMCIDCGHTSICYDCSDEVVEPVQLSIFEFYDDTLQTQD